MKTEKTGYKHPNTQYTDPTGGPWAGGRGLRLRRIFGQLFLSSNHHGPKKKKRGKLKEVDINGLDVRRVEYWNLGGGDNGGDFKFEKCSDCCGGEGGGGGGGTRTTNI